MCRSPSVLVANRSKCFSYFVGEAEEPMRILVANVDWALLNFMQDWFPLEAREKLKANEKEACEEELREMGFDTTHTCVVM